MTSAKPTVVALVPARSGSVRVPHKNIRPLAGHPLLAYTISAARDAGVFEAVVVSTDSEEYAAVARHYGAEVPFLRPRDMAGSTSPDIEWILHALERLRSSGRSFDCFSILRPTSPFRRADTVVRAWRQFLAESGVDSLRAVEKCRQHPGKMWVIAPQRATLAGDPAIRGRRMLPLMPFGGDQPWHSTQYAALPEVWEQNASLEIAWTRVAEGGRTIAGTVVVPFLTEGWEGLDVNDPLDWRIAEELVRSGEAVLPRVASAPYLAKQT